MDLNESVVHYSRDNFGDTALSLKCLGSSAGRFIGTSHHHNHKLCSDVSNCPDGGCRLVLGLGPTPPSYYYNVRVDDNNTKGSASFGSVQEGSNSILQLGPPAVTMDTFSGLDCSLLTYTESNVSQSAVDEGSTSARRSGGYMQSLLFAPRTENVRKPSRMQECSTNHAYSSQLSQESEFSERTTGSATSSQNRMSNPKKCKFMGCAKGARGASGLCIGHGGGQRCQKQGCSKGAESKTTFCKAHGGGKRCQHLGCTKSAEGKTDFCISHGGGRRCGFPEGCAKAARGKSGLCIKHGGGKRCRIESCTRSAEGQAGLCISHGGGRRCQSSECTKGAQGSTNYCKAHGGGKRCIFAGCTKGAEGSTPLCKAHGGGKRCMFDGGGICPKSVHGGTSFCVAHGGGKRCVVAGCTKSARGRTDCCVKHGGGKRCKSDGCEKSAQGSTDFCKAHGGGKLCSWEGDWKCEKLARGKSGLCAAHNSMSQDKAELSIGFPGSQGIFVDGVSSDTSDGPLRTCGTFSSAKDYDVVISYGRGDISIDNFISHLRASLCRRGISLYEEFNDCDAVPECRVLIILLTSTYVPTNLLNILEHQHTQYRVVYPVFYKLSPYDFVCNSKSYEIFFPQDEAKRWQSALKEITEMPGYTLTDKSESELIDEIVRDALKVLYSGDEVNMIGIDMQVEEIFSLLCIESLDVRSIGIWGMVGIGKTTIAEEIFRRISVHYETCVFLKDLHKEVEVKGHDAVREDFLSKVLEVQPHVIRISDMKTSFLRSRLQRKRVLVILDDVNDYRDFETFLGKLNYFWSRKQNNHHL